MANLNLSQIPHLQDDPVQKFFRQLEDPALFERADNVPIFCKSVKYKKAPDGTVHRVEVTDGDLEEVSGVIRDMEEKRGSLPVITPGHRKTDPKTPEEDQPAPWGYARWATPGHYTTPAGVKVPALLGTVYFSRTAKDKTGQPVNQAARTYPFRSVDYYPETKEVTGVALLRRDPELDLGLVAYGRTGRTLFCYASENVMGMPETPAPTEPPSTQDIPGDGDQGELQPEEAEMAHRFARHYAKHHPAWKFMCDQFQASAGGMPGMPGGGTPGMPGATPSPLSPANGQPPMPRGKPPMTSPTQMQRDQLSVVNGNLYQNGRYVGAITNPYAQPLPDLPRQTPAPATAPAAAPTVNGDGVPVQYQKEREELLNRIAGLEKANGEAARDKRLAQYERDYGVLRADRPTLPEFKDVLPIVEALTPEQYQKYLELQQKAVPPAPTRPIDSRLFDGRWEGSRGGQVKDNGDQLTEAQSDQVMQYLREHPELGHDGTAFDKARAAVFKN